MPAGCFLLAESTEKPGEAYNVEAKVCPLQAKVWGGGGAGTQRTAHSTKHACSWVGPSIVRLGWLRRDSPLACNAQKGRACTVPSAKGGGCMAAWQELRHRARSKP